MNNQEILELKIDSRDHDENLTIRGYLHLLLTTLWEEEDGFSGKHPFGNGCWQYDVYKPLVKYGVVEGEMDYDEDCEYIGELNESEACKKVLELIDECFIKAS